MNLFVDTILAPYLDIQKVKLGLPLVCPQICRVHGVDEEKLP